MDASAARELARRFETAGREVADVAGQVRAVGSVRWQCPAASAFRREVAQEASALVEVTGALHDAATAWRRHAARIEAQP